MDIFSLVLAIVAVLSLHQLYISRRVEYSIVGILATMLLPITVIQGVIDHQIGYELTAAVVLIMSAVTLVVRAILVHRPVAYQQAATALFGVLTAYASLLAISSGEAIWFGSIATISAVLLYVASFVVRQPLVHIASHAFGALGVLALFGESLNDYTWAPLAMGVSLGAILYGLRWYFAAEKEQTADAKQRVDIMAISAVTLIILTSFISLVASETIVAGALIGCVGAGMIAYEGFVRSLRPPYEIALYIATICLQRLVAEVYPDASFLVYTHWWAVTGGLAALLYYKRTDNISHALVRSILALVILSVPSGLFALADPNKYQLLFLLEHVALIVAGVATGKSLLIRWGAVGVVLALLWLLRGYTYVLLALLALSLISLAIWRLLRKT